VSPTMAAKAYRLLRAVLMTAVKEDEILTKNPCRIPGADQETPAERPILTVTQVFALVDELPERYRALVLLTTFASLRWGEVIALQRMDIDTDAGTIRVRQSYVEVRGVGLTLGPPKSRAGRRTVTVPALILPAVRHHLKTFVPDDQSAFVFTGPTGTAIWRGNFNKLTRWHQAVRRIGQPSLHFHDLRHTGNTLAADTGTSLRNLMTRMGHDSPRAALIYQHASQDADRAIAEAVNALVEQTQGKAKKPRRRRRGKPDDGAAGVLVGVN
jgi:integrase